MENKISFSRSIKDELASKDVSFNEGISILAAFIRLSGSFVFKDNKVSLVLKTEISSVAKYIYKLLKTNFPELDISFRYLKKMKLYKNTIYVLNVNDISEETLDILKIDFLDSKIDIRLQNSLEKVRGYLIGTFLSSGSCTDPNSSNYHLEFCCNDEKYANSLLKLIKKVKNIQLSFKITNRRSKYIVYLKRSDEISSFLAFIDAREACLAFEDVRASRDFFNSDNRLINCDTNNFQKTLENGYKQITMIKLIDEKLGIENIQNEKIKELCKLRLENVESNYRDLGVLLGNRLNENVSKSNINHLFIKIKKMAENYGYSEH